MGNTWINVRVGASWQINYFSTNVMTFFWLIGKGCDFLPGQSQYAQTVKRVNQDSTKIHVLGTKRLKTRVNKLPLALVLPLIGWKSGTIFCLANHNTRRQSYAPITTQRKHMKWVCLPNAGKCTWLNCVLQGYPREFVAKFGARASQPSVWASHLLFDCNFWLVDKVAQDFFKT